ncbi:MAG: hypothetical protein ACK4P4_01170 [Allorhizobium sp.]
MNIPIMHCIHWALLATMLGFLVVLNVILYNRPIDISPAELDVETPSSTETTLLVPPASEGTLNISHTLARPLFSPTRREFVAEAPQLTLNPTEQAVEAQPSEPPTRPALTLQGTRFVGQEGRALIALESEHDPIWIKTGDQIQRWTVAEVGKEVLVLIRDEQRAVYALYETSSATVDTGAPETNANGR